MITIKMEMAKDYYLIKSQGKPKNIVILILESFGEEYTFPDSGIVETLLMLEAINDVRTGKMENLKNLKNTLKKGDEVTFFCGDLRRDELPDILGNNGIIVHEVERMCGY